MNIMKNKKSYILFWLLLFPVMILQYSCTEKLDLLPKQSIDAGTALTTPENIKATLVGTYLQARDGDVFGSSFTEYSELIASTGDLLFIGSYDQPRDLINKNMTATFSYAEATWIEAYELINLCNTLVDPEVLGILDPADAVMVEAEARFLRGWVYFEMAKAYGLPYVSGQANAQMGVPTVLTPTSDISDAVKVTRNSVMENYTQALLDLNFAKDNLDPTNDVYATSFAASAVLARIYLQMGDFDLAVDEANNVIENGGFSLVSHPLMAHNNSGNTSEDIFALQNNIASNTSWLTVMFASLNGMGRGDYDIQQVFLDTFDPLDLRGMFQGSGEMEDTYTIAEINKMYYYGVGQILNSGGINTAKWGDYYANLPLIRLAEMYLIRAEANFESGAPQVGPNTPLADINIIRGRSLAPALVAVTQADIRQERYWELCWEGHRLHDLKRWQIDIDIYPYDAGNLILPIPFREIQTNELLVQNPYYLSK
jgi:hypothetical protein